MEVRRKFAIIKTKNAKITTTACATRRKVQLHKSHAWMVHTVIAKLVLTSVEIKQFALLLTCSL